MAGPASFFFERGEGAVPYAELDATIGKMLGESKRAAEVVGRLRDFFRSGTTQLEEVTVESLLESARRIGSKLDASGEVDFRVETDTSASVLLADRLQIELVLRNLLANTFEAVANQPAGKEKGHSLGACDRRRSDFVPDYRYRTGAFPVRARALVRTLFKHQTHGNGIGPGDQPGDRRSTADRSVPRTPNMASFT